MPAGAGQPAEDRDQGFSRLWAQTAEQRPGGTDGKVATSVRSRDPGKARHQMRPGEESKTMLIFSSSSQDNLLRLLDWVPRNTSLLQGSLLSSTSQAVSTVILYLFVISSELQSYSRVSKETELEVAEQKPKSSRDGNWRLDEVMASY